MDPNQNKEMYPREEAKEVKQMDSNENDKADLLAIISGKPVAPYIVINNHNPCFSMNKHGYEFSFAQLEVVAQYAGFRKDSGSSREVHYVAEGIEEAGDKKEDLGLRDEIFDTARDKKSIKRTPIFIFEEDVEKFKDCVDKNSFYGLKEAAQAVIFKRLLNGEMIIK